MVGFVVGRRLIEERSNVCGAAEAFGTFWRFGQTRAVKAAMAAGAAAARTFEGVY